MRSLCHSWAACYLYHAVVVIDVRCVKCATCARLLLPRRRQFVVTSFRVQLQLASHLSFADRRTDEASRKGERKSRKSAGAASEAKWNLWMIDRHALVNNGTASPTARRDGSSVRASSETIRYFALKLKLHLFRLVVDWLHSWYATDPQQVELELNAWTAARFFLRDAEHADCVFRAGR